MKRILITENQFNNLVNNLLNEDEKQNRINKLKSIFPKIEEKDFNKIIDSDPTNTLEYSFWLLRQYNDILKHKITNIRPEVFLEDLYKTKEDLKLYHKIKYSFRDEKDKKYDKFKNINNIRDYKELYDVITPYKGKEKELISKGEQQRLVKTEEADMLYEDNKWLIVHPKTEKASCIFGKNTRWCVAYEAEQGASNQFKNYSSHGRFYFLKNKQDINEKYAFFFDFDANDISQLIWDKEDKNISESLNKFFNGKKELLNVFWSIGQKEHAWKFLLTTGFKDWVNYVDPKITRLDLVNLNLNKISEGIGKLTNLTILNIVNNNLITLPNSIGNLKSLVGLTLSRNKLIKLPDSIGKLNTLYELTLSYNDFKELPLELGKLTNLQILYVSNNENLKNIPQSIKRLPNLKNLNYLVLNSVPISEKDKQLIQKLLPNTKVRF